MICNPPTTTPKSTNWMLRIANPQSLNRLGHFLTADCKSAERLAGAGDQIRLDAQRYYLIVT